MSYLNVKNFSFLIHLYFRKLGDDQKLYQILRLECQINELHTLSYTPSNSIYRIFTVIGTKRPVLHAMFFPGFPCVLSHTSCSFMRGVKQYSYLNRRLNASARHFKNWTANIAVFALRLLLAHHPLTSWLTPWHMHAHYHRHLQ